MKKRYIIMSLSGVMSNNQDMINDAYITTDKVNLLKDVCKELNISVCILGNKSREKPESAKYFYDRLFRHLGFKQGISNFFNTTNDFLSWLLSNDVDYIILSADPSFRKATENQVIFTNYENGLQETDITKIKQYFNKSW